ncbi:hypothetical protein I5168_09615 [Nonlabens sp. SCSIO 43208]|uniref:hypothetical protein n=1 Tax=Nonlabens sp. SCSIO 43208 TaxID=2793009 RepID=UPI003D6C6B4A
MEIIIKESYNRPFEFIPKTILWIIKQRDLDINNDNLIGINSSIILSLTSLIESFNKELMISWVKFHLSESKTEFDIDSDGMPIWDDTMGDYLLERLSDELILEIESSEWNKQLKLFTKITNDELKRIIKKDTLIGMNQLFNYRNILTHGNKLSLIEWINNNKTTERLEPNKFEAIFSFLKQQNLIEGKLKDIKANIFELTFSNNVIDYFISIINLYLEEVKESFGITEKMNKTIYNLKI